MWYLPMAFPESQMKLLELMVKNFLPMCFTYVIVEENNGKNVNLMQMSSLVKSILAVPGMGQVWTKQPRITSSLYIPLLYSTLLLFSTFVMHLLFRDDQLENGLFPPFSFR